MQRLQSASGYGGLEATPLARIGYINEIMNIVYERDFLPEITNGDIDERIVRCNQEIQLMRPVQVGPWRPYQKNQEMVPNQVNAEGVCIRICNAAYNDIKIDELDIHFACERWDAFEASFLEAVYERYVEMQRKWVFTAMILEASPRNKGRNAGKFGNIDLGTRGNPVVVTPQNLALRVSELQTVLLEQLRWVDGEMFMVMPVQFRTVLMQSDYANNAWTGNCKPCSFGIDGMWELPLGGFNIIETVHSPFVIEADGRVCFYIIAGHRSAFAYASDIIRGRIVTHPRTFGVEYQMLAVWGGKMLYPDAIAIAYWTFQNTSAG